MTDQTAHGIAGQMDALRLLQTLVEPCEGADEHSWRKCRRCAAVHGIEMRFGLSMRLLQTAISALAASLVTPQRLPSTEHETESEDPVSLLPSTSQDVARPADTLPLHDGNESPNTVASSAIAASLVPSETGAPSEAETARDEDYTPEELAALKDQFEAWKLQREMPQARILELESQLTALRQERDALAAAIRWALGEDGTFPAQPEFSQNAARVYGRPRFWWRKELRKRAFGEASPTGTGEAE